MLFPFAEKPRSSLSGLSSDDLQQGLSMPLTKIMKQPCHGCKLFFPESFVITSSYDGIWLSDHCRDFTETGHTTLHKLWCKTGRTFLNTFKND
jgi:hypothetical protein